jgi:hypothetical protein
MNTKNKVATTIKIPDTLYDEFKVLGVRHKLTLQGLIEKTVYRYVKEEGFRNDINNFTIPSFPTGSFVTSSISTI